MNATAIQAILALVEDLLPKITTSDAVQKVIDLLIAWAPIIFQFFKAEIPVVKNLIAILSSNPATLPAQRQSLNDLSASADAMWDDSYATAKKDEDAFLAGN